MNSSKKTGFRLGIAVALLAALGLLWKFAPVGDWARTAIDWLDSLGPLGAAVFAGLYVVLGLLSFPSTVMNLASGILFEYWQALLIAWAAGFTASAIAFQLGRQFFRDRLERQLKKAPKFRKLIEAMEGEGFKIVLLARLNPFVPASLKNYGFGATDVPYLKYLAATAIGQLPIAAAHVYLGWVGGRAAIDSQQPPSSIEISLMVMGGAVSVALVAVSYWYGKRALER